MRRLAEFWTIFREGVEAFFEDEAQSRGAAIAFYAVTAMGPALYICAWLAGLFFGTEAAYNRIIYEIGHVVSRDTAAIIQNAIIAAGKINEGFWPTIAGAGLLVLMAGGVFVEVQAALNHIWKVPNPAFSVWRMLRSWIESIALVMGLGVLLCASLLVNALVGAFGSYFENLFGIGGWVVWLLNFGISTCLISVLFAAVYMVLPNRALVWNDVVVGAIVTTVLIVIGEQIIAVIVANVGYSHRYGPAGGAVAFLMWIYYSVQVFLLGAEFTKIWSVRHGSAAPRSVEHSPDYRRAA